MIEKCISMLPSPPTTSPTNSDRTVPFYYPDYESPWSHATCLNTLPLPYKYINDRPNYSTAEECCKIAYAGQRSRACICSLNNPPTRCPNVVKYEVTTTLDTSMIITLSLEELTVPTSSTEKATMMEALELILQQYIESTLSVDSSTITSITIISINGQELRKLLSQLRRQLMTYTNIEFEIDIRCNSNCEDVKDIIFGILSDQDRLQRSIQNSGNGRFQDITIADITYQRGNNGTVS